MARDADPFREIATRALCASRVHQVDGLRTLAAYAFDQLCWALSEPELEQFLGGLRAKLSEDA